MKTGLTGAFRMGLEHGYYCVGCCWMYMLVMLAVTAMSLPAMILLTVLITLEKITIIPSRLIKWIAAALFVALGLGSLI